MIGFGVRLQVLSVTNLIYDPATKFVLSAVAGPAALGLYETAYRLVFYARALIIAPSQNLTPKFASFGTDRMDLTRQLYQMSSAMFSLFGALGGILLVLASPLISVLLLKHAQPSYTVWVAILSIGWFFNIAAAPAYLMGIGTGQLRWNIIGSAFTALCSLVLGYCLGQIFGGIGVVVAASVAIAGGGIITAAVNCRIAGLDTCLPTMAAYAESVAYLRREVVRALAPAGPRGNGSI
jgi:O-antigen/teichoic acid export membrane protein